MIGTIPALKTMKFALDEKTMASMMTGWKGIHSDIRQLPDR
ncbi:MAG: hypothetical protein ABIY56_02775 [Dokdonella sp.]